MWVLQWRANAAFGVWTCHRMQELTSSFGGLHRLCTNLSPSSLNRGFRRRAPKAWPSSKIKDLLAVGGCWGMGSHRLQLYIHWWAAHSSVDISMAMPTWTALVKLSGSQDKKVGKCQKDGKGMSGVKMYYRYLSNYQFINKSKSNKNKKYPDSHPTLKKPKQPSTVDL